MHKAIFNMAFDIFVSLGMPIKNSANHVDVLNRSRYKPAISQNESRSEVFTAQPGTIHVMMYMFPRQFGLHNVITSIVDPRETAQPFKDYTTREDEIGAKFSGLDTIKIPKRLRGKAAQLVQKLQILHHRCPYKLLLEHYCSVCLLSSSVATY